MVPGCAQGVVRQIDGKSCAHVMRVLCAVVRKGCAHVVRKIDSKLCALQAAQGFCLVHTAALSLVQNFCLLFFC